MSKFSWDSYLRVNRAEAVPKGAFHTREPMGFTIGMALEVVDKKNPSLIRPAVVTMIDEYQIKVLFIGWPERYAYWIEDDSCDIFPPGYCKKTNHPIECPLGKFKKKTLYSLYFIKMPSKPDFPLRKILIAIKFLFKTNSCSSN